MAVADIRKNRSEDRFGDESHYDAAGRVRYCLKIWSRREDLNTPSAAYDTAALTLSYTGSFLSAYSLERAFTKKVITLWGRSPRRPRWSLSLTLIAPLTVKGT